MLGCIDCDRMQDEYPGESCGAPECIDSDVIDQELSNQYKELAHQALDKAYALFLKRNEPPRDPNVSGTGTPA